MHTVAAELSMSRTGSPEVSPGYRLDLAKRLHVIMAELPRCELLAKQILATALFLRAACARPWLSFLAATFVKRSLSCSQISHKFKNVLQSEGLKSQSWLASTLKGPLKSQSSSVRVRIPEIEM